MLVPEVRAMSDGYARAAIIRSFYENQEADAKHRESWENYFQENMASLPEVEQLRPEHKHSKLLQEVKEIGSWIEVDTPLNSTIILPGPFLEESTLSAMLAKLAPNDVRSRGLLLISTESYTGVREPKRAYRNSSCTRRF